MSADKLTDELLDVAKGLIPLANDGAARRSISSAYYALFGQLVHGAAEQLIGGTEKHGGARSALSSRFSHKAMLRTCEDVAAGKHDSVLSDDNRDAVKTIALTFKDLQAHRVKADYRLIWSEARALASTFEQDARASVAEWRRIRTSPDGRVFTMLLLGSLIEPPKRGPHPDAASEA